uniref:Uncharacterized protein n=1 Tax=Rhizophora mucronata TaxID=61149 RepID=A0A2P2QEL9_RHIMU
MGTLVKLRNCSWSCFVVVCNTTCPLYWPFFLPVPPPKDSNLVNQFIVGS